MAPELVSKVWFDMSSLTVPGSTGNLLLVAGCLGAMLTRTTKIMKVIKPTTQHQGPICPLGGILTGGLVQPIPQGRQKKQQ